MIIWESKERFLVAFVLFVLLSLFSPILGFLVGLVVFAGAAQQVDVWIKEQNSEIIDVDEGGLRSVRFLDAFACSLPLLSRRKRHKPTEHYSPPPGKLVSLFGTGAKRRDTRGGEDAIPFFRLTWFPPKRLSFWAAVAGGGFFWAVHMVGVTVAHRLIDAESGSQGVLALPLLNPAGALASFAGGFLLVAATAEALRWAHQEMSPNPAEDLEPVEGYVLASLRSGDPTKKRASRKLRKARQAQKQNLTKTGM